MEMAILDANFNGLQHIGVPVTDLERSKAFYSKLGFEEVMLRSFEFGGDTGWCCMMKRGPVVIEMYQMPAAELEAIRNRGNGHIDHVSFDVNDIDKAFSELKEAGFTIDEEAPFHLDFWDNGCRCFNVIGPDGERLEFSQIL
jgi:lactoylglutathione lyase